MIPQKRFKLTRQAMLLATISATFPVMGYCAAAGFIEFEIGTVESVAANGTRHPLYKGSEINSGEAISTAANGRAQVRFADGGYISLQPNTLFRVDDFNYQGSADGQEKGFFSLLKGGFRAITGLIGHVHKGAYQVKTPAATLGIRGTGYNMALRDEGLFVNVGEGAISLNNKAGFLVVTAGGAAFVADFNTPPKPTTEPPFLPPTGLKEPEFTVADQRDSSGNLTILPPAAPPPPPPTMVSGTNFVMSYAYAGNTAVGAPVGGAVAVAAPVTTTFNAASQLTGYTNTAATETGTNTAGTLSLSGQDGVIGWGRWTGAFTSTGAGATAIGAAGTMTSLDYVVGIPTAVMPTTGTVTYNLLGSTTPTATNGTTGYTVTASVTVNFALTTGQVGVNMTVANAANSYTTGATPLTISGSTFTGAVPTTSSPTSTAPCSGGCTTSVNGFFAGTNAARVGLSYTISNISGGNSVQGVAAFK